MRGIQNLLLQQVVHIVTTAFNWLDFAHEVRQLPAHGGACHSIRAVPQLAHRFQPERQLRPVYYRGAVIGAVCDKRGFSTVFIDFKAHEYAVKYVS